MKKPKSITIITRAWYGNVNGNSEFASDIYIDGAMLFQISSKNDGGDAGMDEQISGDVLEKAGYMPKREHYSFGGAMSLSMYLREHKIAYIHNKSTVGRRKDL